MHDYSFCTHGVGVEAEHSGVSLGLRILRTGFGAKVRQNRGTSNWFHLALPTLTLLDGDNVRHHAVSLGVDINNDAVIKRVHVRKSIEGTSGWCSNVYDSGDINITGQITRIGCDVSMGRITGPLAVCAYVEFEGDGGEIRFIGAGVLMRPV
jgi:hypothetical protein